MKRKQHEQVILGMMKEFKKHGFTFMGNRDHQLFLIENKMIEKIQIFDRSGNVKIKYRVTKIGEGLIKHIENSQKQEIENAGTETRNQT